MAHADRLAAADLELGSPSLDALLDAALAVAKTGGASYADARFVDTEREEVRVRGMVGKDPAPEAIERRRSAGFGVRVLLDGAWGFACTAIPTEAALTRAALEALAIARATAPLLRAKVVLAPSPVAVGRYATPYQIDPFTVPVPFYPRRMRQWLAGLHPLLQVVKQRFELPPHGVCAMREDTAGQSSRPVVSCLFQPFTTPPLSSCSCLGFMIRM